MGGRGEKERKNLRQELSTTKMPERLARPQTPCCCSPSVVASLGCEDRQGTIWAGHTRSLNVAPPLCRLAANEFKCFAFSDDPEMFWIGALKEDRNGDLWIGSVGAVCRWRTGKSDCYAIPAPRLLGQKLGVHCMAIASDTVWVDGGTTGIWQLKSGRWKHYDELPELKLWLKSCLVDHEGGLWFGDVSQGVIRRRKQVRSI